ncbi:SulP family inorganic anion transporter [Ruficoccus sp. ZRK36]|uniref:SulP family inorganic anion transporter n=1 Tax=Ruficoccus sp. ZRK36 TaxID=2866311 RepID=UPI001C72AB46|nr:SulP family inorganic anion transporter [Ruficoccus sp. ZRK36]QYY37065.1 SulP family inorganic anion transporter [Ruficoccus sp. ZRK36]
MLNFFRKRTANLKDDLLSGLTVALALVPEAIAFAFVAGVSPIIGLYSAFFMGLITAVFGGRPGMISGATGAVAVVLVTLVAKYGVEYMFPTVVLCGIIQVLAGMGKLGQFIRMVPYSVMLGFVNGLAIVIFMAQFGSFKTVNAAGELVLLHGPALVLMLALVGLTMLIIWLLPKLTRAVPASLAAILIVTGLSIAINKAAPASWEAQGQSHTLLTVGDMLRANTTARATTEAKAELGPEASPEAIATQVATTVEAEGGISAGLPKLFFLDEQYDFLPPMNLHTLWIIFPFALTMAAVGLIESLMTLSLIDEITETRGRGNRECLGQGLANIVSGMFGGMGGCAMIGQSLINVNSGGRGRASGITAALCLLSFVLVLAPWIEMIPMAALVGVMFMVVIGTFEWASLRTFRKIPFSDVIVMVVVAAYTVVMHDLATAVVIGVIISALVFAWRHATHLGAEVYANEKGARVYQLHGPLFFASVASFKELFKPHEDPDEVIVDFYFTRVYDQSGLEAINTLTEKYQSLGKRLHLTHLSPECRKLLDKAGDSVEVNLSEDPQYHVATERLG